VIQQICEKDHQGLDVNLMESGREGVSEKLQEGLVFIGFSISAIS
jgi:hypothetical protein